jgi:hypothetical protein
LRLDKAGRQNAPVKSKGTPMRSTIFAIVCGAALAASGAAIADPAQPPPPTQPQPAAAPVNTNPVTCRYYDSQGDLVRGECHTQHEWDAKVLREQEAIREFQLRSLEFQ